MHILVLKHKIIKGIKNMNAINEKNNSLIYNETMKYDFLRNMIDSKTITEETSKNYLRIFGITSSKEKALNKDLNQFTLEELETILYAFKAKTRNTIETYARIISSYLNWSVQHNKSMHNPLAELKPDDFEKYITNEEQYFTEKQLRRWEDRCTNYQDAVIIRLLFMGVSGKQMSEIRNLKKKDVDIDNRRLRLINTLQADKKGVPIKFTERYLDIDERTLELIEGAMGENIYAKRNGEMEQIDNIRPYTDLVQNDYVVRASITKTENWNTPVDKFVIYRRIDSIANSLGIEDLTAKFIQRSGMIYHARKLVQDNNFSLDDLKIVADRFNIKSYHNLKGFLTIDNILKTYPQK
jgi:integrase